LPDARAGPAVHRARSRDARALSRECRRDSRRAAVLDRDGELRARVIRLPAADSGALGHRLHDPRRRSDRDRRAIWRRQRDARALAAGPDVLVLDEPTSALDPQSESLISASLKAIRSELTLFIVAHRMSTLEMCDRVMVIVDGRLESFDTRAALQRDNLYYR